MMVLMNLDFAASDTGGGLTPSSAEGLPTATRNSPAAWQTSWRTTGWIVLKPALVLR